jgi:hypothetical protein
MEDEHERSEYQHALALAHAIEQLAEGLPDDWTVVVEDDGQLSILPPNL